MMSTRKPGKHTHAIGGSPASGRQKLLETGMVFMTAFLLSVCVLLAGKILLLRGARPQLIIEVPPTAGEPLALPTNLEDLANP